MQHNHCSDSLQGVDITKYKDYVVKYLSHVESINGRVLVHCLVGKPVIPTTTVGFCFALL